MSSKAFKMIEQGMLEALEYARGNTAGAKVHRIEVPDVGKLRQQMHLSQPQFADLFGVPVATLRNWEQGIRQPQGPAKALLTVIQREPAAVMRAIAPALEQAQVRGRPPRRAVAVASKGRATGTSGSGPGPSRARSRGSR